MIKFINNLNYVEVIVDKTTLPSQYWDTFRMVMVRKLSVERIVLDINDNHVAIYFKDGGKYYLNYQVIDASHGCNSNEDLYNLLNTMLIE